MTISKKLRTDTVIFGLRDRIEWVSAVRSEFITEVSFL